MNNIKLIRLSTIKPFKRELYPFKTIYFYYHVFNGEIKHPNVKWVENECQYNVDTNSHNDSWYITYEFFVYNKNTELKTYFRTKKDLIKYLNEFSI